MNCLETALRFEAKGLSVIPIEENGKIPLIKWAEFQSRRASSQEIEAWFKRWPKANLAIVTGAISGLMVMDVDVKNGAQGLESVKAFELPTTQIVKTPSGGIHFYFKMAPGIKSITGLKPGIDIRAEGGLIVSPPSSINGVFYQYMMPLQTIQDAQEGLLEAFRTTLRSVPVVGAVIPLNVRNSTLTSLAGRMRKAGMTSDEIESSLRGINERRCEIPISEQEVKAIAKSVGRYPSPNDPQVGPTPDEIMGMSAYLKTQAGAIDKKYDYLMGDKWNQIKRTVPSKATEILSARDQIDFAFEKWTEGKCGKEEIEQKVNHYKSLWDAIAKAV